MKNLRTPVLCVCVMLIQFFAFAQGQSIPINEPNLNKPKLFQNLPDFIPVDMDNLNALLGSATGRTISTNLSVDQPVQFQGKVISTSEKYENSIISVVIRSSNFQGAQLTVSKIFNTDGTIKYTGRLMSFQHGDLYELQTRDNRLYLVKRNFYDLVNE
jgi:hypothetical protein